MKTYYIESPQYVLKTSEIFAYDFDWRMIIRKQQMKK